MYAVILSGGKQFRVEPGLVLNVEKLEVDEGQSVDFDQVLLVGDGKNVKIGLPYVAGAKVSAEVIGHGRSAKINIIKMHRRKHHMKHLGHRQYFTKVKITDIVNA